ncbi:MAG: MFS transporter [Thermodesulfobacteriota bacterium]
MVGNRTFRALRHRNFRLFFFGQLTSLIGSWMQSVAQGWLVLQLSNSAFALGLVGTFGYLPTMLFSFWGGSVADRKSKRRIVLATQTVAMCLAFSLAFLVTLDLIKTWQVVLLAFSMGTVMAFDLPARQSFLIELVGREDLTNAIGLNSSIFNAARLIGPGIAGFVIAYFGVEICFLINGLSFLAVIVSLLRMRNVQQTNMVGFKKRDSIKDMAYYIHGQKEILMLLLLVATFSVFVLPYTVLLPIFARDILKVGPKGLGFLFSAMGLGALIGAIIVATIAGQRNKLLYLWSNALLFGAFILGFSLCNRYYLALFLLFLAGMTMVGFLTTANAYVQLNVSDDRRGRIMGLYSIVFLGMMPLGSMLSGSLSQYIGVQRAVATGTVLAELITLGLGLYLLLIMGSRRRSDNKD